MKIKGLVKHLEKLAPLSLAESWDNVGLLIESSSARDITRVLATIDLTEPVVQEAITKKCSFVISYHPPIFSGMKRLTQQSAKDRIVIKCIENGISVYSPHTSWDSIDNGVNDWLTSCFSFKSKAAITPNLAIEGTGMGRIITLSSPLPLTKTCDIMRAHLGITHLRLGHADPDQWAVRQGESGQLYDIISTIAVCAGSGGTLLKGVDADLYITGEMSHHEVLAAVAEGRNVLLSEHTHTERGFLKFVTETLSKQVGEGVEFIVSESDCNPLDVV